jgi:diadenylate cyclase
MGSFQELSNQVIFLISKLTWFGMIDLLLVTAAFYFLLNLVRRSAAAYLMREVLLLGLILFVLTTLLPLPVFDWLVRGILVVILIATPVIFQAQLRRFFERIGRASGIGRAVGQNAVEKALPELLHAVERMAASRTGALIVLEGNDSLEEVTKSGIPFGGRVTRELLQSIFYSGTPLHDGAVIIRTDRVIAAGCVLPLSQQSLRADKRLGTRHRAAVGITENSDALAVVVSEETGQVSIAYQGLLRRPVSSLDLREKLVEFFDPTTVLAQPISLWGLVGQMWRQFWHSSSLFRPRHLLSNIGLIFISLLLTVIVWSFVVEQTNPFRRVRVDDIALRVENIPDEARLIPAPPTTVSAVVQTTDDVLPSLRPGSFQAVVALEDSSPGLYRLPIEVNSGEAQVLVLGVDPPALDFELAPVISRTLPILVAVLDQQNLSAAYELVGSPIAFPDQVQVVGPAPLVEQVDQVRTSISLANATTSLRETRPVQILDAEGREINGLTVQPGQVQVNVSIRRRLNARDVSVQAIVTGNPASDYQLSRLTVTPANVTLQGSIDQLAEVGNVVNTLPVDVSLATHDLTMQVPLDLPPNVQAMDNSGQPARIVMVSVEITARSGNLAVSRPIKLLKTTPNITVTIDPPQVDLLLSGPLPILNEVEADPDLIQVLLDVTHLRSGRTANLIPEVITPVELEAQVIPPSVLVVVE